ncbi:MAG: hypothetical protein INF91_05605 [Alphaproteobacteria bacterium]|nr:hypothetical protein [Alphaproteobacteria bacterium]
MGIHTAAKNLMLDALTGLTVGAFTAWPGDAGSNEVSGGSYARVSATFSAAASGARAASNAPQLAIPAATTPRWIGYFNAGGTLLASFPIGGFTPFEFTVDATADTINALSHGLSNGQSVVFHGGTAPSGLTEGTEYFVRDAATDSFKVAATAGGSAIDLTGQAAAGCVCQRTAYDTFTNAGTLTVTQSGTSISLNF